MTVDLSAYTQNCDVLGSMNLLHEISARKKAICARTAISMKSALRRVTCSVSGPVSIKTLIEMSGRGNSGGSGKESGREVSYQETNSQGNQYTSYSDVAYRYSNPDINHRYFNNGHGHRFRNARGGLEASGGEPYNTL